MTSKRSRAPNGEAWLGAFLARPSDPEGTLSFGKLRGFPFAMAAALASAGAPPPALPTLGGSSTPWS
jgi:hypothetical protein